MTHSTLFRSQDVPSLHPHLSEVGRFVDTAEAPPFNPLALVLRLARGRLARMALLSTALAGLFGTAGFLATEPDFESRAIIRISAREPSILFSSGDDSRLKLFNAFVKAEATLVASRPVMERASQRIAEQRAAGVLPVTAQALSYATEVERKDALIVVTAKGPTGADAAARVNAVVNAYRDVHAGNDARSAGYRESELASREADLFARLIDINRRMLEVGGEYGTASLAKAHIAKVGQIETLEARRDELAAQLAAAQSNAGESDAAIGDDVFKRAILLDRGLADLSYDKAKREAELAALLTRYEEHHKPIVSKRAEIAVIDQAIADRREQITVLGRTGALTDAEAGEEQTADEIGALAAKVEASLDTARAEATELNAKRIELTFLEEERNEVRRMLDETRRALDMVRVESRNALPGMVEVISDGAVPDKPADDMRLVLAAGGGLFGLGLGVSAVLGLGLLSRRVRYSDDLPSADPAVTLLGVVPSAARRGGGGDGDARVAEENLRDRPEAATAIDRIRNAVQLLPARSPLPAGSGRVIALLSACDRPSPAFSIALAASFARTGLETILVDADLTGQGLATALGETVSPGFREAVRRPDADLAGRRIADHLSYVPAGLDRAVDRGSVALAAVRRVLAAARGRGDVILVHLGGADNLILAELVASEADLAILAARQGEDRIRVGRLARRTAGLARNGAGLVLLDARKDDPARADNA